MIRRFMASIVRGYEAYEGLRAGLAQMGWEL
jgi:hypothetical protein